MVKEFEFSNSPYSIYYSSDDKINKTLLRPDIHYFQIDIKDLTDGSVVPIIGTRDAIFIFEVLNLFR